MRFTAILMALCLISCASHQKSAVPSRTQQDTAAPKDNVNPVTHPLPKSTAPGMNPSGPFTSVAIHNVVLHEQSGLQLRVRWLRGRMFPAKASVIPSFDDPDSFVLLIDEGTLAANLQSFSNIISAKFFRDSPLTNLKIAPYGTRIKVTGTLHKGVPLPVQLIGSISAASDGRIHIHADKLSVLKVPVKGLMNAFHIQAGDLFNPKGAIGMEVNGNDIFIDSEEILPPPRKRGKLTGVHVGRNGDLVETYGNSRSDAIRIKEWRNFMRMSGGTISFGKLIMENADLYLIDISQDDWFEFDLARYQEQLVNGFIRVTPQAGLHVFMPDITKIAGTAANRQIGMQWLKNRNTPPPPDPH